MPTAKTKTVAKRPVHHRAKARVAHHYFRVMPNKKYYRIAIWIVFFVVSFVIGAQMMYPLCRAVPFATLSGESVGWWKEEELAGELARRYDGTMVKFKTASGLDEEAALKNAGAEQQASANIERLRQYPFWQRLIPFSILWQRPNVEQTSVSFSPSVLRTFSIDVAKKLTTVPQNATLSITNGELIATSDSDGQLVTADDVRRALETTGGFTLGQTTVVDIDSTIQRPETISSDLREVRDEAERAIAREIRFTSSNETVIEVTAKQRASWLEIAATKEGVPELAVNRKALQSYFAALNKTYGTPAGETKITLVNGIETGRTTGKNGEAIRQNEMADLVVTRLLSADAPDEDIPLVFTKLTPSITYNGRYTSSEAGLRAYVRDITRDGNITLSIRQLSGNNWSASGGGATSRVSASTFKLYVALYLFDQMNKGNTSWNDSMLDTTVSTCFDRMTIASTNPCAYEWLNQWGRGTVNNFLYANGFSTATTFTHPLASHTSTDDLVRFMAGLETGSLIGGEHRDRLLSSLNSHPYRSGVPAGSAGRVHNKVGFLWDYLTDGSIVYHADGTYVMGIITKGQSYARIAEITRELEKIMYP
jgi:beta-lactamase class A